MKTKNPADPGAIDLHAATSRNCDLSVSIAELREDGAALIAAVEALREQAFNAYCEGWDVAHEPARCGHARANYKDPEFGTPEYKGNEKCEACAEVEALRARNIGITRKNGEYAKWASESNDRAEVAKARIIKLNGWLSEHESKLAKARSEIEQLRAQKHEN